MSGELILVVDDEPNIVQLARLYLEKDGYTVTSAGDGCSALEAVQKMHPDLIILDLMLPELDGLEVCRRLRAEDNPVPIIMLTARDEDIDKVLGLEIGADVYMTKPFNPRHLTAQVKAILRRADRPAAAQAEAVRLGNTVINPASRAVRVAGEEILLRAQEFDLILVFARHISLVLTREQLLNQAWGYEYYGQSRTVDVHVGHLRKKMAGSSIHIETVAGVGYKALVD